MTLSRRVSTKPKYQARSKVGKQLSSAIWFFNGTRRGVRKKDNWTQRGVGKSRSRYEVPLARSRQTSTTARNHYSCGTDCLRTLIYIVGRLSFSTACCLVYQCQPTTWSSYWRAFFFFFLLRIIQREERCSLSFIPSSGDARARPWPGSPIPLAHFHAKINFAKFGLEGSARGPAKIASARVLSPPPSLRLALTSTHSVRSVLRTS